MRKKPLELSLYTAGAGAFSVFLRWLQDQLAFNDAGLVDKSAFNVILPVFLAVAAAVFVHFINLEKREQYVVPEDFDRALLHEGRLYRIARDAIGVMMVLGALLLFASSETDKLVRMLRLLALLGVLTGLSFPLLLAQAGKKRSSPTLLCLLSFVPILFFGVWLLYSYRANSINSVIWAYITEIAAASMGMVAFWRVAGLAFGTVKGQRLRFDLMFTAVLFLMTMADERYMGMHIMFLSAALMLLFCNWVLTDNLEKRERREEPPEDGFERLS